MKVKDLIAQLQDEDPEAYAVVVVYGQKFDLESVLGKESGSAHSQVVIRAEGFDST